uniref:Peptide chain release factor 1 n=1 Tax=Anthurium amnicola TaxID=1678845 RepID=A0A1D1XWE1_9ARAE
MVVFLLRVLLWAVGELANVVSLAVFRAAGCLIVLAVQAVKAPARAADGMLGQVGSLLRSGLEHLVGLLMDTLLSLLSNAFDLLVDTVTGSFSLTASAAWELVEKTRAMMEGLSEVFPEAFAGIAEMVGKVTGDLWNNFRDAVEYVASNI